LIDVDDIHHDPRFMMAYGSEEVAENRSCESEAWFLAEMNNGDFLI
jgi:hypothetical protein